MKGVGQGIHTNSYARGSRIPEGSSCPVRISSYALYSKGFMTFGTSRGNKADNSHPIYTGAAPRNAGGLAGWCIGEPNHADTTGALGNTCNSGSCSGRGVMKAEHAGARRSFRVPRNAHTIAGRGQILASDSNLGTVRSGSRKSKVARVIVVVDIKLGVRSGRSDSNFSIRKVLVHGRAGLGCEGVPQGNVPGCPIAIDQSDYGRLAGSG